MTGPEPFTGLRFQLLGPLRAWRGTTELDLGQMQQRVVLAVLLLHADSPVGRDQLVDAVWGWAVPARAANLLQRHVSGLRRVLEPDRPPRAPSGLLAWTEAGYLLTPGPAQLDVRTFDGLIEQAHTARAEGDRAKTSEALHAALDLWHGRLCEGLTGPLVDAERDRLAERRLSVLEERIEVDLSLGDDFDLVGEIHRLTVEHPLREGFHGLLMLALHRAGRQAEALEAFRRARRLLRDELGIEPGQRLRRLHARILADDPGLDTGADSHRGPTAAPEGHAPRGTAGTGLPTTVAPAQLPHPVAGFVGREEAIARLDSFLPGAGEGAGPGGDGGTVVITAIGGTAGVGKTTLAVHWAHRVRDRFPDGQLYVNLRGFDPSGTAMHPAEAIRGFLDALGVPAKRIPVDPQGQIGLYRSLLANRRMLVVLDNAQDADQVRPLLPGSPDCFSVITSRSLLTGLVVTEGAQPVGLGLMSGTEAGNVLARRIGTRRLAAEPDAMRDIIASCARLPLALAIVGARAATHPQLPLAAVAKELHAAGGTLDLLGGDDESTDVRRVFSWSYQRLTRPAARLFRLLGLHPGPDISLFAVAGLAGLPVGRVRPLLRELTDSHLLTETTAGRYAFHDLLRIYAGELALAHDTPDDRAAAIGRMLDHCLLSAYRASRCLSPHRDEPITLISAEETVAVEEFADHDEALSWFLAEHAVLLALQQQALSSELHAHAWQLAWTLRPYLDRGGHWHDSVRVYRRALQGALGAGSTQGRAVSHGCLAYAYLRLSQYEEAATHIRQALDLYEALGDPLGQAHAHRTLTWLGDLQGRYEEALDHAWRALALFEAAGHPSGQARALNSVGWFCSRLGRHEEALGHCERALRLHEEAGDRFDQADTWDTLGHAHHRLHHYEQAAAGYERALAIYRETGDRYNQADTLCSLGDLHQAAGDPRAARAKWRRAAVLLEELGHREAAEVRARLSGDPEAGSQENAAT
ncbi:SARP family transcriptional regulator [Streptomyces tauricus]|uniref:Tetratricopeptide repeat protein n=1 Tax=Streptomyces tauricus TaxID=68274 RepID=A0ABZ1JQX6_9ACTN|nr:BTAD domain-containing putative transcriptional regulator [Streptomyces tauricus]MCW8096449.1 BTAD domain-containing putative transcriptional regulator [Streptomyces tauricus]GHA58949.1 SARP family transcriptional regulator [Streptomyces tauricus]